MDELRAIRLHLVGRELTGLQAKTTRLRDQAGELAREEAGIQARLRELDISVLDAERALTDVGHGDVADALTRVEAMRERARGLRALVVERRRGLERELAAAADEGVVETLVADAGAIRAELDLLDPASGALAEQGLEVDAAERDLARERAALVVGADASDPVAEADAVRRELAARRDGMARIEAELERFDERVRVVEARHGQLAFELTSVSEQLRSVETAVPSATDAAERAAAERTQAEDALVAVEARWREAESDASRWQARADALAQALDATADAEAAAVLDGMVGVAGALVNHLVIDPGAEHAVAAALGDAMGSLIVSGRDEARTAVERLAEGDAAAWLLVLDAADTAVTTGATLAPAGSVPLATCVRAGLPGLQATLARTLAGVVLAEGDWRAAMDLAASNPDLTVMTRAGDRFGGGRPWRFGGEQSAGATRAALDEAIEAAERAVDGRDLAQRAVDAARVAVRDTRETEQRAAEAARAARSAFDRAQGEADRLATERDERNHELELAGGTRVGLVEALAAERSRLAALEARVPELEAAEADAQRRADLRESELAELEASASALATLRREHSVRGAALDERRTMLTRRLTEVEARLARDPEAKAAAERYRAALVAKGGAYDRVGVRLDELTERVDGVLGWLREQRRIQTERASAAGGRLEQLRTHRHAEERQLSGVRERQQRREVEEAENRMRLEAAVERIRTDFDCEPGGAMDAVAPEVPEGSTLAGRARDLDRDLRLMGPDQPARAGGVLGVAGAPRLPGAATRRRQELAPGAATRHQGRGSRDRHRLRHGVRRRPGELRVALHHTVPGRLGSYLPHGPGRPPQHRDRDGGSPVGQEHQAPVAPLGGRAVAHRDGIPVRGVPVASVALLPARRGRGGARRREPPPVPRPAARVPRRGPAGRGLAPEADHGGGRLPLRSHDGTGRLDQGGQPAHARRDRLDLRIMSLLAASAADELELVNACGRPGSRSWLCERMYDLTGNGRAAEVADGFAKPFRALVIIVAAYIVVRVARLLIRRITNRLARSEASEHIEKLRRRTGVALLDTSPVPSVRRALRAETIGAVLRSVVSILIWATAFIMILDTFGVNLAAIGVGASIIGVAIGFGSQSLVRDFLSGVFMLVEDQYGVGDVIDAGLASGTVEGVSLRTTRLRDIEGVVWHIPNGEIRRVGNKSQQWARALLDVPVAYDADIEAATEVIRAAAESVATDPEFARFVVEEPEVLGVEQITSLQVVIRLGVKTRPLEQWKVARELRIRVKRALDEAGIKPGVESIATQVAESKPQTDGR